MTHAAQAPCPICKLENQRVTYNDGVERLSVQCPRCGNFTITATAARMAESRQIVPLLSAWIREATEAGREIPEINSRNIDAVQSALPAYSVSQKQLLLIRALSRKSKFPGDPIQLIPEFDFPLAWATNEEELTFYLRTMEQRGLIRDALEGSHTLGDIGVTVEITSDGWEYLDERSRQSPLSVQAFVAMSFADDLKPLWLDAIAPAIDQAGYKPYRVDSEPHIDRIDAKIVAEIRNSKFLVADVTQHKLGVYFEAGYALGLSLPVIWTVHEDDLAKTHFDTRQYNHIVWRSPSKLKEELYLVICAVIGKNK
jgi:DNA-binding PadR family transcriptional regulator